MRNKNFIQSIIRTAAPVVLWIAIAQIIMAQAADQAVQLPREIDQYLMAKKTPTKPLADMGSDFLSLGNQYGVDPRLIVAISGAESSFGAHVCTQSNAWNWFWEGPCPKSPFDSWQSGIKTVTHFMHKSYLLKGYNTIPLIGAKFCVSGCEHWVPNVTQFYTELGGDVNNLAWATVPGAPMPEVNAQVVRPVTIVASLASQAPVASHWWQKDSSGMRIGVQATIHGGLPLAQGVKLVRKSAHGGQNLTTLSVQGATETGDMIYAGEATLPQIPQGTLDLEVVAAFPAATSHSPIASNLISLTVIPSSNLEPPLIIVAAATALSLLAVLAAVLWSLHKKAQAAPPRLKHAA